MRVERTPGLWPMAVLMVAMIGVVAVATARQGVSPREAGEEGMTVADQTRQGAPARH